jgi:hypothetical protein
VNCGNGNGTDIINRLVCTSPTVNATMYQAFRTFKTPLDASLDITIVQAVRATCAMPRWFPPVVVGKELQEREYIACPNSLMNPVKIALKESNAIFGPDREVACILSLGSGETGPISASLYDKAPIPYQLSPSFSSSCRMVDEDMQNLLGSTNVYHRFSVDHGLESSEKFETKGFGEISEHTHAYLSQAKVERNMTRAGEAAEARGYTTIGSLCKSPSLDRDLDFNGKY